jgi:hypothetical protein
MTRPAWSFVSSLAIVMLLAGCASAPNTAAQRTASAPSTCSQLGAGIARTYEAKRAATEKKEDAWKAVIPFAVVGRYASARSDVNEADQRLAALQSEFNQRGCAHVAG